MGRLTAEELARLEPYRVADDELAPWSPEPLAQASRHHLLCDECDGRKYCDDCARGPHPYCDGFCRFCGGAGQIPIHPDVPLVRPPRSVNRWPRPIIANLDYLRREFLRRLEGESG